MAAKDNLSDQFGPDGNVPISWSTDEKTGNMQGSAPHAYHTSGEAPLDVEVYHEPTDNTWNFDVEGMPKRYGMSDMAGAETFGYGSYRTKQRALWAAQSIVNQHHGMHSDKHDSIDVHYHQGELQRKWDRNKAKRSTKKENGAK